MKIKEITVEVLRDHTSDKGGNKTPITTNMTNKTYDNSVSQNNELGNSNLQVLLEFKKNLIEEQKVGESTIQTINEKIDSTKKDIDDKRVVLEDLRNQLKKVNEVKDSEYTQFMEIKKDLVELRNKMKSLERTNNSSLSKSRKERFDMTNLSRILNQIEKDIQTKKLSKEEERKLVVRSKETAVKLHALKIIYKKEDDYRNLHVQYEQLKANINIIFNQKAELGEKIGKLKESLDSLLNLREELYEERRKVIRDVREAGAKLEMVDTQLNAIEYRRTHQSGIKSRRFRSPTDRKEVRQEVLQERIRRNKENLERWNVLKDAALKKMSNGEKLTFEEMKLIYGDDGS